MKEVLVMFQNIKTLILVIEQQQLYYLCSVVGQELQKKHNSRLSDFCSPNFITITTDASGSIAHKFLQLGRLFDVVLLVVLTCVRSLLRYESFVSSFSHNCSFSFEVNTHLGACVCWSILSALLLTILMCTEHATYYLYMFP